MTQTPENERNKILNRIKALLEIAAGNSNMGATDGQRASTKTEAEAAALKAQELVIKYQISQSEMSWIDREKSGANKIIQERVLITGLLKIWKRNLVSIICGAVGEETAYITSKRDNDTGGSDEYAVFVGSELNVQVAVQMYLSITNQLDYISELDWRKSRARSLGESKTVWMNSFFNGAVNELYLKFTLQRQKMKDEAEVKRREDDQEKRRREADQGTPSTPNSNHSRALVPIFSDNTEAVNKFLDANFNLKPSKKIRRKPRQRNQEGYNKGSKAGREVEGLSGLKE